jgi:hypothetical protein
VPIIYKLSDKQGVKVHFNNNSIKEFEQLLLDVSISKKIFERIGEINKIEVYLKK